MFSATWLLAVNQLGQEFMDPNLVKVVVGTLLKKEIGAQSARRNTIEAQSAKVVGLKNKKNHFYLHVQAKKTHGTTVFNIKTLQVHEARTSGL
ncbi:putative RNA helicase [Helianthus anomalus]